MTNHIDIVFDGALPDARFVEVEDSAGKSIQFGEWVQRPDGHWVLRIHPAASEAVSINWEDLYNQMAKRYADCTCRCAELELQLKDASEAGAVPVVTFMGKRLTPHGTRECWGILEPGADSLIEGTKLFAAPPSAPAAESAEPGGLPDPHGCNKCQHPDCGRFNGPHHVECRAMADNACARDYAQPTAATADAQCCTSPRPDCMGMLVDGIGNKCAAMSEDAQGDERARTLQEAAAIADAWAQEVRKHPHNQPEATAMAIACAIRALSRQPSAPASAGDGVAQMPAMPDADVLFAMAGWREIDLGDIPHDKFHASTRMMGGIYAALHRHLYARAALAAAKPEGGK